METRIAIDEGEVLYLQMLYYELTGLQLLNQQVLRTGRPSNEIYERFLRELCQQNKEYSLAFNEVISKYAPEFSNGTHEFSVDFLRGELVVMERRACHAGA